MKKRIFLQILLYISIPTLFVQCKQYTAEIEIDMSAPNKVEPIEYGWHYEEIGMIGDGGLYAELIRNHSFEEANPPAGLTIKNGIFQGIPNPTIGELKKVSKIDSLIGWHIMPEDSTKIRFKLSDKYPINDNNLHCLEVTQITDVENQPNAILNDGYFGINAIYSKKYKLSFYAKKDNSIEYLSINLVDSLNNEISDALVINDIHKNWQKYEGILTANSNCSKAKLKITAKGKGKFWLDMISLFPANTYNNGKSVFRADILKNLIDYKPDFLRFPGGCIVHGVNEETMYHWKNTIGPVEKRIGGWSKWKPNYRTDGIGYHEFLELCEYLNCDAMYVTPSGLVCDSWVYKAEDKDDYHHPDVCINDYIQDVLDAIEYAVGSGNSFWGSKRVENGHPDPFKLKYVEIGNEDFGSKYYRNYDSIYKAIHKRYPNIKLIANSIIGRTVDADKKRERIGEFIDKSLVTIFDEHYYKDIPWLIENYYKFDKYDRSGPDMFIGELGIRGSYPLNNLGEAIFMMNMERNADLKPMLADRPLMRNWDFMAMNGDPLKSNPLYYHTSDKSFKTFNYYMSKLFRDNKIDIYYPSKFINRKIESNVNDSIIFSSVGLEKESGDLIIKLVNLTEKNCPVSINLNSLKQNKDAELIVLKDNGQRNTPDHPDVVKPIVTSISVKEKIELLVYSRSFTVVRIKSYSN